MTHPSLFEPYALGALTLANRIVMAPLTRNRAGAGLVPSALAATYYAQRASAGLLITEATQISPQAQGYQDTPGLYTPEQIAGWRAVTDAVHAKGGRIFVQLWHVGRVSHVDLQPGGAAPVAPSAIRAATKVFVNNGFADVSEPRALALHELPGIVDDFRQAAANAIAAGFDGVEIHGANGYLLEQFIKDGANQRTDAYGGSIKNRARLLLEVVAAVGKEIGADRTGVRISPVSPASGISCSDPQPHYDYIAEQLDALGSSTCTWSKVPPAARATRSRSTMPRCAASSPVPIWPTTATTWNWPTPSCAQATSTWWPSAARSSATPILSNVCTPAQRWRR